METLAAQSLELLSPGCARGRGQVPQNNATHPRSVDNYCQHRTGEEECKNGVLLFGAMFCAPHMKSHLIYLPCGRKVVLPPLYQRRNGN